MFLSHTSYTIPIHKHVNDTIPIIGITSNQHNGMGPGAIFHRVRMWMSSVRRMVMRPDPPGPHTPAVLPKTLQLDP